MIITSSSICAYEIDFVGGGEEVKKDGDAIAFRWKTTDGTFKVFVYDGGLQQQGECLKDILNHYYFDAPEDIKDASKKIIDAVFVSHSDQDHTVGLNTILENFQVNALYMNRPWLYVDELFDRVDDGRITRSSLEQRLRENYSYVNDLETTAIKNDIPIYEAFQGTVVEENLTILSPAKEFYLQLLAESEKTPLNEDAKSFSIKKAFAYVRSLISTWLADDLRDDVETSVENEMSVVLLGDMNVEKFLLVGDAGQRALSQANDFALDQNIVIRDKVKILQIPHHGGRHNIGPTILNTMVGGIVSKGITTGKEAYVSAAKDSDHPLAMVTNAYIRRGVKVYKNNGNTICHHQGNMPERGWGTVSQVPFSEKVEEWDD